MYRKSYCTIPGIGSGGSSGADIARGIVVTLAVEEAVVPTLPVALGVTLAVEAAVVPTLPVALGVTLAVEAAVVPTLPVALW